MGFPSRVDPEGEGVGRAAGIVLAAGAGSRMGGSKALLATDGVPWLVRAVEVLTDADVREVVVVLGAAPEAAALVDDARRSGLTGARAVIADDWAHGPGASLAAGLSALSEPADDPATCAVITLVDLPDVDAEVVRRVMRATGTAPAALGRATYAGRPGHPVVLGRDHWHIAPSQRQSLLREPGAHLVECSDLAGGADVDSPDQLPPGTVRIVPTAGR